MNARLFCLVAGLTVALTTPVFGNPTVEFGTGGADQTPDPIGNIDCDDRLAETLNITALYDAMGETEAYTLRLLVYTGAEPDCASGATVTCPSLNVDDSSVCGCIEETTQDTIAWRGALSSLGDFASVVCNSSSTIKFRADIDFESADREDTESSPIEIITDMDAPSAPESKPIVQAGETALVVSLESADRSNADVVNHEICLRPAGTASEAADAGAESTGGATLADLRAGFSNCQTTSNLKNGEFRYTSLVNDQEYEVVVAAMDAAGNRSANSPIATGTPASLLDFAELYDARRGDADGETGGCSTYGGSSGHFGLLGLLLLVGALRRRVR